MEYTNIIKSFQLTHFIINQNAYHTHAHIMLLI